MRLRRPRRRLGHWRRGTSRKGTASWQGTESFADGETRVGDTVITCDADEDGGTCELTVAMDDRRGLGYTESYSGSYSGGTITLSVCMKSPIGSQALTRSRGEPEDAVR